MFHHSDAPRFRPQVDFASHETRWYVDDDEYQEAIRRGMMLRSQLATKYTKALFRRLGFGS